MQLYVNGELCGMNSELARCRGYMRFYWIPRMITRYTYITSRLRALLFFFITGVFRRNYVLFPRTHHVCVKKIHRSRARSGALRAVRRKNLLYERQQCSGVSLQKVLYSHNTDPARWNNARMKTRVVNLRWKTRKLTTVSLQNHGKSYAITERIFEIKLSRERVESNDSWISETMQ